MKVFDWSETRAAETHLGPFAAAIGVFDGLHIGHKALIGRININKGLLPTVVTFRDNPKKILRPSEFKGDISTAAQKLECISKLGVQVCLLIDFSGEFSKLPGKEFLSGLAISGAIKQLAIGSDFRCGNGLDCGSKEIRDFCAMHDIALDVLDPVRWKGTALSSSGIRAAILEGKLEDASSMLGRPHELDLTDAEVTASHFGILHFDVTSGQVQPPDGHYEAVAGFFDEWKRIEATRENGVWSIGADTLPSRLRLLRMVSRE